MYKTAKRFAVELIYELGTNIEYTVIGERMVDAVRYNHLPEMVDGEFEAFQEEVANWIDRASIGIRFREDN